MPIRPPAPAELAQAAIKVVAPRAGYALFHLQATSGTWYWVVHFSRNSKRHYKRFYEPMYGGSAKARAAAVAWRDAQLKATKPLTMVEFCQKARNNNTSGVPGVCFMVSKAQPLGFWQAKLKIGGGKYKSKSFSVLQHGERGAYKLAVAARQCMLAEAKDAPYLYDPLAKKMAKQAASPHALCASSYK